MGPNGAGKTSLARVVSRQVTQVAGNLWRSPEVNAAGVAYVCFEQQKALCDRDRKLDDAETRGDAFDAGTTVRHAILGGRAADSAFLQWVQRLRMEHILERGLRYISTGEMRKTLLVKALLSDPALLILDSPLDGLDRAAQAELQQVLGSLLDSDLAVLMLCRNLEDVPRQVTHIMVLEQGSVRCQGERDAVLSNPDVRTLMDPPPPALGVLPPPQPRPYTLDTNAPRLALRGVNVSYGDTVVLRDVDWTLCAGQHCSVSGPNGCGKTTLLSLVTGDNHKAYGQDITLFGVRRGSGESVWDIKQKFGQLDTSLHLNFAKGMKTIEVVVSGFFDSVGLYDDWGDQQRAIAQAWLQALGVAQHSRSGFDELSFGLQRMVLLARAMVKSPAILILDEPCLGLDSAHRKLVLRAVDHIAAHTDTQIVYVSHSAGEMPECINQWLIFKPEASHYRVTVD